MVPTIPWMKQKFAEYNKKYFGGRLPVPNFNLEAMDDRWGKYDAQASYNELTRKIVKVEGNGTITLTSSFSRKESACISTLLHEMCHEYVTLIMRINPKDAHGAEFESIANKINQQGHNIKNELPITDDDIEGGQNEGGGCVLGVIERQPTEDSPNVKWWICKIDPKETYAFQIAAKGVPNGNVKSVKFYHSE